MMTTEKSAGRAIGVLLLGQMVCGYLLNFVLLQPVFRGPEFLTNAATHAQGLAIAVLVSLVTGMLSIAIAIAAWPVLRQYGHALALWLLALALVNFALGAVEDITVLSIRSVGEAYVAADAADAGQLQVLGDAMRAVRKWAHYLKLILGGGMALVLYAALYRFTLVPRALAGFGIAAVLLQLFAVTLPLFGHPINFMLLAPIGLSHLLLALWLLAKGFAQHQPLASPVRG